MEEDEIDDGEAQFPCIHSDGNGKKSYAKKTQTNSQRCKFAAMWPKHALYGEDYRTKLVACITIANFDDLTRSCFDTDATLINAFSKYILEHCHRVRKWSSHTQIVSSFHEQVCKKWHTLEAVMKRKYSEIMKKIEECKQMNTELASLDVLHGTLPRDQKIPGYVPGAKSHVFRKRTQRFLLAKGCEQGEINNR